MTTPRFLVNMSCIHPARAGVCEPHKETELDNVHLAL